MQQNINPFLLSGYISEEYFCDREQETAKVISALNNGRNITLISPRRMGKTGLIRHVFNRIQQESDVVCYYVDLYQTRNLSELIQKLGSTILGSLDTTQEKVRKGVMTSFKSLRPVIAMDAMTGDPSFSIDLKQEYTETSLKEIFAYMEQSGKQCVVAFDEFQTVTEYEESNIEAMLRSYIQHLSNVRFIFSGSQRHVIQNMFHDARRPFYQSTQTIPLGPINEEAYYHFANGKMPISNGVFSMIYSMLYGHTWYIQSVLNRIYEKGLRDVTADDVRDILDEIVSENEPTFHTFMRLITPAQRKLLQAVAHEGRAVEILGQSFIQKYHLSAPSTIKSAVATLVEKELLLDDSESYQVYDRFFALWLQRL